MSIQVPKDVSLIEGEIPIWSGQMSWASMWLVLLIAIVCFFTIILIFISIIFVIFAWVEISSSEYFVSSKRIYIRRGLISRVVNDIKIEWITNIYINQGIVGRVLNFGSVGISSPGERGGTIGFIGVSDPMNVKATIEETLVKYKNNP
jgi:uncharacterized membrane protein YdbT with pleckstrin-like domain